VPIPGQSPAQPGPVIGSGQGTNGGSSGGAGLSGRGPSRPGADEHPSFLS
jgi:hypothetical protein